MSRLGTIVAAANVTVLVTGLAVVSVTGFAQPAARPPEVTLAGSAAPFTSHTKATGDAAGSQQLTVQLWLKPDIAAAQRFTTAASTPGSLTFRHYLTPTAYTTRFGPSASEASATESWLRSQGFTSVHSDAQRTYVRATASTSKIDAAFRTTLKLYKASASVNAGPYPLWANDRPVTLPATLAASVLGVTGLDNATPATPSHVKPGASTPATPAAKTKSPAPTITGSTRSPACRSSSAARRSPPRCAGTAPTSSGRSTGRTRPAPARARPSPR